MAHEAQQMIAALRLHAFDDCGERPLPTHLCNVAADFMEKLQAENEALREELAQQADGSATIASLLKVQDSPVAAALIGMLSIQEQAARAVLQQEKQDG